jgi:hypothetical protein
MDWQDGLHDFSEYYKSNISSQNCSSGLYAPTLNIRFTNSIFANYCKNGIYHCMLLHGGLLNEMINERMSIITWTEIVNL